MDDLMISCFNWAHSWFFLRSLRTDFTSIRASTSFNSALRIHSEVESRSTNCLKSILQWAHHTHNYIYIYIYM
jgi:hypothetical protein